jgi:hypothetical protein
LAHFLQLGDPPGEIHFPRSECIVSHEVVGTQEEIRLQGGKLLVSFGQAKNFIPCGIEKVSGIHQKDIFFVFAQVFQEGSPPGQTAKLAPPSAAGLVLAVEIRAEDQGNDLLRLHPGRLPPGIEGDQAKEEKKQKSFHEKIQAMVITLFILAFPFESVPIFLAL